MLEMHSQVFNYKMINQVKGLLCAGCSGSTIYAERPGGI